MISPVMPTYARADIVFERGEGAYLFDVQGRRYLDFSSGIAVTALGHNHPHLVAALVEQAGKLWHTSNGYRIAGQEKLAPRLIENSFADTVFFCNSGVEAWECGVKLIRKHFSHNGQPERWRIITVSGSFHGRTLAALAAAKQDKHTSGFGPLMDGFDQVAFGNLNELRAAITPETAAINIEPVQGEGGLMPASAAYLQGLRQAADEFGLLLYFDEIQCGMGRTGKLFAYEWAGIEPDVMCVAKGIGGGFPLGACLATAKAADGMGYGSHGSTFGGNPLAMAVGNAVMDELLKPGFMATVEQAGRQLRQRLEALVKAYPAVFCELRGLGLMLGLKTVPVNNDVIQRLRDGGLLTVAAGDNVIRLLPPLIIGEAEINEAVGIMTRVAQDIMAEQQVPV
jgi:acetylornithine/N-succinyldiaminopimelate aminotransferase